jgi:hypothetical protein
VAVLLIVTGIVVIGVGVLLTLLGAIVAWGEFRQRRRMGVATGFLKALTEFVRVVADKRPSLGLMAFGVLLVFLGGVIAGVSGLKGC